MKPVDIALALALAAAAGHAAGAAEPALRWSAPISVQHGAALVALPLPASAYRHSLAPGLADMRVVDAAGRRVPHAWLPPAEVLSQPKETPRDASAYPLPPRAAPDAALGLPVDVLVQGDRIRVRRLAGEPAGRTGRVSPGWLFDLGERAPDRPAPQRLRLAWSGPAEFSAAFDIDSSATLRDWHGAGSGQVMALASPSGALVQRDVPLPPEVPRFVRLVWRDPAAAPQLTGAQAIDVQRLAAAPPPAEPLVVPPSAEPPGRAPPAPNALHFDLGANLPLAAIDLQWAAGTHVAPLRVQARQRSDAVWHELGSWVFYRLERDGTPSRSPPLAVQTSARYLRLLPDERAGAPDPATTQLVVRAALAELVFASQGSPPYRLLAGAKDAADGALPITTLVPQLDQERPRMGRARLGDWTEDQGAAEQAAAAERLARLRPGLLWGVLLAGVAVLGTMVWRLARGRPGGGDRTGPGADGRA